MIIDPQLSGLQPTQGVCANPSLGLGEYPFRLDRVERWCEPITPRVSNLTPGKPGDDGPALLSRHGQFQPATEKTNSRGVLSIRGPMDGIE